MKKCNKCGELKSLDEFGKDSRAVDKKNGNCKVCVNKTHRDFNKNNPDIMKNKKLKRRYGITLKQKNQMLEEQKNLCPLCEGVFTEENKPYVDHNHDTKKVRGLLHHTCNIHLLEIEFHKNAIEYLKGTL